MTQTSSEPERTLAEAKALAKKKGVALSYAVDLLAAQRREALQQKKQRKR